MKNVIIIGRGPAGVSASLYTVRAGFPTLVIGKDGGALDRAERVENYYGVPPTSGRELGEAARKHAEALGVSFLSAEVTSLEFDGVTYKIKASGKEYLSNGVILATGAERRLPPIEGAREYLGSGVSQCAVCDSFAARGRRAAVIGAGEFALEEAAVLLGVAKSVVLCTDGAPPPASLPAGLSVREERVAAIRGAGGRVSGIDFRQGEPLDADVVFLAEGTVGAAALALRLGLPTEGGRIVTGEDGRTALPRLYAAGDVTGPPFQISLAVAAGARAGLALSLELRK
ncbi:MAG: FAD-dependent oxidoreductase [Clostridia bacterium]|nr:FAD-dependent oxidoreductase [Clostridia bacterium]